MGVELEAKETNASSQLLFEIVCENCIVCGWVDCEMRERWWAVMLWEIIVHVVLWMRF